MGNIPSSRSGTERSPVHSTLGTPPVKVPELVNRLLASSHHSRRKPSKALKSSPFGRLPPELICKIASWLPDGYAAVSSVLSRQIYDIVGTKYFERLQKFENRDARPQMFRALFKEVPDVVFCECYKRVHRTDKAHLEQFARLGGLCVARDRFSGVERYVHDHMSSTLFAAIMKQHRLGYSKPAGLRYLTRREPCHEEDFPHMNISDARTINGSLFIRSQQIVTFATASSRKWPKSFRMHICPHFGSLSFLSYADIKTRFGRVGEATRHLNLILHYWETAGLNVENELVTCSSCRTEYQIDLKQAGADCMSVYFTKWMDLGSGIEDLNWKAHLLQLRGNPYLWVPRGEGGSIKSSYENGRQFRFDKEYKYTCMPERLRRRVTQSNKK